MATLAGHSRFWTKVTAPSLLDCWLWTGCINDGGYGVVRIDKVLHRVHRLSYQLLVGPIPEGTELDHVRDRGCRHKHCVNPLHLEPVVHQVNILRGSSPAARHAVATHCKHDHEFTEANTYRPPSRPGSRQCRECTRIRNRRTGRTL